jgi:hypothetical protein
LPSARRRQVAECRPPVQRILRHSDPRLTANIYSRVDVADLQAGVDGMGIPGAAVVPS